MMPVYFGYLVLIAVGPGASEVVVDVSCLVVLQQVVRRYFVYTFPCAAVSDVPNIISNDSQLYIFIL